MKFHRVIIVGVGQIGASIGLNLVGRKWADDVIGADTDQKNLRHALKRQAIQKIFLLKNRGDLLKLRPSDQDLVILATPVLAIQEYLSILPRGPLIMDVGSTKRRAIAIASQRGLRFIGAHPMAGTEREGVLAADKDLFRGKICLLTPARNTQTKDRLAIARIWKRMGCRLFSIPADLHDRQLALASHLPHVAAYSLMSLVGKRLSSQEIALFSGGGFRDTTRIAASSAGMWADIFLDNPKIAASLNEFQRILMRFRSMIRKGQRGRLRRWLEQTSRMKRRIDVTAHH